MRARAPGKVVISGAYSVLWGAPAIVSAVDRYVEADTQRAATFVSEEMRQALSEPYPYFDASALRSKDHKLGLGSSAAILLAALGAVHEGDLESPVARDALFERAVLAHRRAQGGGSGVDVAASTYGGTQVVRLPEPLAPSATQSALSALPQVTAAELPAVVVEVWASPTAASTADFIRKVATWALSDAASFRPLMNELTSAAEAAVSALSLRDSAALIAALDRQGRGLTQLGDCVGLPICVDEVRKLAELARAQNSTVLPAGAGGGDVSLFVGSNAPSNELRGTRAQLGLVNLDVKLGVRGLHRV